MEGMMGVAAVDLGFATSVLLGLRPFGGGLVSLPPQLLPTLSTRARGVDLAAFLMISGITERFIKVGRDCLGPLLAFGTRLLPELAALGFAVVAAILRC